MRRTLRMIPIFCLATAPVMHAQSRAATFTAHIQMAPSAQHARLTPAGVVLWLTPLQPQESRPTTPHTPLRLTQKNKQFSPHLLVVPIGSSVEFPNLDPFFHNVFSLFNGKRFDLGLYEAGSSRSVRFDREGVSYLFCNIHPRMGAIVLSLRTPYYAIASATGDIAIPGIPPGDYQLNAWGENVQANDSGSLLKTVHIPAAGSNLGTITLQPTASAPSGHKNKFGEDYMPEHTEPYK